MWSVKCEIVALIVISALGTCCTSLQHSTRLSQSNSQNDEPSIQLETMDDLEHVSYFSMRNFNLTDDNLLMGMEKVLAHRQYQRNNMQASILESADSKGRLAFMLESFISHLRNGHLRRLDLEELESTLIALNLTTSLDNPPADNNLKNVSSTSKNPHLRDIYEQAEKTLEDADIRCKYLTAIYKADFQQRLVSLQNQEVVPADYVGQNWQFPSDRRLTELCLISVKCQTAASLIHLINGPCHGQKRVDPEVNKALNDSEVERLEEPGDHQQPSSQLQPRSLRDSLSLSVAKLCPILLFKLHDHEGLCLIHRDDRPPMATVWGFATLFVTIVSFCSLIGLSITPLISSSDAESIVSSSSDSSASSFNYNPSTKNKQHRACLNLFEGLAVGSLAGSALFSLIPQAFELEERESNQGFLLKAMIIFCGIYLFFCSERIMRIILDLRQKRKKDGRLGQRSNSLQNLSTGEYRPSFNRTTSSSGRHRVLYCDDYYPQPPRVRPEMSRKSALKKSPSMQLRLLNQQQLASRSLLRPPVSPQLKNAILGPVPLHRKSNTPKSHKSKSDGSKGNRKREKKSRKRDETEKHNLSSSSTKANPNQSESKFYVESEEIQHLSDKTLTEDPSDWSDEDRKKSKKSKRSKRSKSKKQSKQKAHVESYIIPERPELIYQERPMFDVEQQQPMIRHNSFDRHLIDDSSSNKQDISTVAWMIIIGDGLHNLIDGISIGAAFSESILSGVSISVAVICEEFPHELGDFAVLVSSGMTVRQALGYNFLSACTCYFGMAIGIILGDVNDGAAYISALAAGVFLYIALVDMMGELAATLEDVCRDSVTKTLKLLLLQNIGICLGISVILILSFIDL